MAATGVVPVLPYVAAVEARLRQGLPVTTPETKGYIDEPADVPRLDPATGRVQRYWVLHPFFGRPADEQDLAETGVDRDWTLQVTVAAGFKRDCLALATLVDDLLYRWAPVVAGHTAGELRPPPGFDPGPARVDESVNPSRFWLPLQYRTTITRHLLDPA